MRLLSARLSCLIALSAMPALSQGITFGIKGGVPLTDLLYASPDPGPLTFVSTTNPYVVGPTIEFPANVHWSIEIDALFRHYRYQITFPQITQYSRINVSTGAWEFPVLLKRRMRSRLVPLRPYLDGGLAWDRLQRLSASEFRAVGVFLENKSTAQLPDPPAFSGRNSLGVVIGGGIDLRMRRLHLSPEIRYTRWTSRHFALDPSLGSNQNQAEFLVGITF